MANHENLSPLARKLLEQHLAAYEPGMGGGSGAMAVPNTEPADIRAAYRELVESGLVTASATTATGGDPRTSYALTSEGKKLKGA